MKMNSKKIKKNVNIVERGEDSSNTIPKKSKKKKTEVTNENTNCENKFKKRKLITAEIDPVPQKKAKKKLKSVNAIENNTETIPDDNIENNVPSTKVPKRKNNLDKTISTTEDNDNLGVLVEPEVLTTVRTPAKGKKKRKNKLEDLKATENNTDLGEGISAPKYTKSSKCSNQSVTVENSEQSVFSNSKKVIHHELNIIDIKGEKVNEDNENVVTISIRDIEGMDSDWDENDLLKQLEKRTEKKEVPKEKKIAIEWPEVDLMELIERMEVGLPENDLKPYMRRTEELEWDKIAFKNYTIEDCKKTWSLLIKKIRRYRILKEVLHDAKQWIQIPKLKKKAAKVQRHPDMPRRPLSAYFIYYLKKKDSLQVEHPGMDATELAKLCSQKFKLLPNEKLMKYENIAKKNKEEYDQKMREFYEIHPELKITKETKTKKTTKPPKPPKPTKPPKPIKEKPPPKPPKPPKRPLSAFQYYQVAELSKQKVEDKVAFKEVCRERWKEMPDDKKLEWVNYAETETVKYEEEIREYVKNHPDYIVMSTQKPQLTKEDLLVKERMSGKPQKPPVSAYNLFARIMLNSEDIKNVPVKDRLIFVSNQWKECTEEEKKHYKELFDKNIEKYNKDLAAYLESLPEAERKLELLKKQPKRRKSEDEKAKKELKPKKATKKKAQPKPEKKKAVSKVAEKKSKKLVEPEQPPISPYRYFTTLYKGDEVVSKAWKALSVEEKEKYEDELVEKKKAYILDFEKFLKSMTKEELENFSNTRKKLNNRKANEDDEDDESSDLSDSEDNSEESGDDDEEN